MKIVTLIYRVEFDDDTPDKDCFASAIEIMRQDRHWPDDDQIAILDKERYETVMRTMGLPT